MSAALNDITTSTSAAVGYFVDQKKGEVNELKTLLKSLHSDKDLRRKREVIKKVIAYMTLGIDVSRLFTDMIMAIETKDIVIKKMVYFYLCNYAHSEPEMAIMCINSLRRDCDNENPLVRGLALRSLCSLRLESILEYIEQPLQKGLRDISAYVRKTAVLGVLKVHGLSPAIVEANRYVEQVEQLLSDPDANVVTNAMYALHELRLSAGGLQAEHALVMALLGRLGEFSEWGLNTVLDLVARYRCTSEEEVFGIMNLLDPVLRTANSGSVLATLKVFFRLGAALPELLPQIIARVKPPLLTLITGGSAEVQYMTLQHLRTAILPQPGAAVAFEGEYRQFFVRYNEPPHVKHLKVQLLPLIAAVTNAREIAAELGEYVTDVDAELAKRAIRALGEIAMRIESCAEDMAAALVAVMDMDAAYVRAQGAVVLADVVRIAPRLSDLVLPHLAKYLKRVEAPEAKAALIWMLGEFGHNVLEAPYLLEQIIDRYADEADAAIKLAVLTAALKLFIQRPPEMQRMLGRLLQHALNDAGNQDLHDRALLYYRLLSTDIHSAAAILCAGPACTSVDRSFAEDKDEDMKAKLFREFNTLAIVFQSPSEQFVAERYRLVSSEEPITPFAPQSPAPVPVHAPILEAAAPAAPAPAAHPSAAQPMVVGAVANLLDWDDSAPSAAAAAAAPQPASLRLGDLVPDAMSPQIFQRLWAEGKEVFKGQVAVLPRVPAECAPLERTLHGHRIFTMASGALPQGAGLKLFVYCTEEGSGAMMLAQLQVSAANGEATATVKVNAIAVQRQPPFIDALHNALLSFRME